MRSSNFFMWELRQAVASSIYFYSFGNKSHLEPQCNYEVPAPSDYVYCLQDERAKLNPMLNE